MKRKCKGNKKRDDEKDDEREVGITGKEAAKRRKMAFIWSVSQTHLDFILEVSLLGGKTI